MSSVSPETLTRLFNEHGAALVLYARQWCAAPEDIVQEGFLRWRGSPSRRKTPPAGSIGWSATERSAFRDRPGDGSARGRGGASRRALVSFGRR